MYSPFHRLELTFHLPELTFQRLEHTFQRLEHTFHRLEHKTYRASVAQLALYGASSIGLDFYADTVSPKIKKVYAEFSEMDNFV